jgi:16S rRNA (guanine527-N7)-methyltransferase
MTPLDKSLRDALDAAAAALALGVSAPQTDTLLAYLALLQRWNGVYNLTSVREPARMLSLHLADCLAVVGPVRRHLGARATARLLDVGSGAGLPGVVIAALNPSMQVTCVETVGKKAAFIQQAAGELGLRNLLSAHARVERLDSAPYDIITSRAFASLPDLVGLTRQKLASGGAWLAMKGKRPDAELAQLGHDIDVFHVEPLAVPGLSAERCLVWMKIRS